MFPVSAPAEASARRIVVPVPEPTVNPIAANASRLREQAGKAAPAARTTDIPAVRETRFVMGLDFGTTYTGIAFTSVRGTDLPLSDIAVVADWGRDMRNHEKVPSVISYTPSATHQQWGSSISEDALTMIHKKLELCPQGLQGELDLVVQVLETMKNLNFQDLIYDNKEIPETACKVPEEIVTDFLKKIFKYLNDVVDAFKETYRRYTTMDLVVTVPTGWPYEALNSTYRAVVAAGFNKKNFPKLNDVLFITESEAAARYVVRHYKEAKNADFLHDNSYFVLCDAGGGTVDVVSYKVLRTYPTLQLQQVGKPIGARCGSIFINQEFKRWLRFYIGDANYRCLDPRLDMDRAASQASETPAMRKLMDEFDDCKERFSPHNINDIHINMPEPLDNLSIPGMIRDGELTIRFEQMELFFDKCLAQIMDLIRSHLIQIERQAHGKAKNLFLVGGFGSSEYLKYYIEHTMKDDRIKFRTPDTSWTAIVQGAVVCGVDNTQIPSIRKVKTCTHSFGVSLDEHFHEARHTSEDMAQYDGQLFACKQLTWLINEGDAIVMNEPRKVKKEFDVVFSKQDKIIRIPIYRHAMRKDEDPQDRPVRLTNSRDEVSKAAMLQIDLNVLRDHVKGKHTRARIGASGHGLYEDVEFRRAVGALVKNKYCVTLEVFMELTWDHIAVSVRWSGIILDEESIRE